MKKIKYSIIVTAMLFAVGCGGGGGGGESTNSNQNGTQNENTQTREVTFAEVYNKAREAKEKINDKTSQAYKDIQTLEDEIKKLEIIEKENKNSSRALNFANFDLTTIPARLQLANRLLEAIIKSATDEQYKYKNEKAILKFAAQVAKTTFDIVNPLNDTKKIENAMSTIKSDLETLKNTQDQQNSDVANINLKEDLAKILRKYRAKSSEIKDQKARADFDAYILKTTGARLSLSTTVKEIKDYINEIPKKYEEALKQSNQEELIPNTQELTKEQKEDVFGVLKASSDVFSLQNLSEDIKSQVQKLVNIFGGLGLLEKIKPYTQLPDKKIDINGTDLKFEIRSLEPRAKLAMKIIDAIILSSNSFTLKPNNVHTDLGFEITNALIVGTNPFAKNENFTEALNNLEDKVKWAKKQPDVKDTDDASFYIRATMDEKLAEYRTFQYNILKNKDPKVIKEFNDEILKVTGIRLDPATTVKDSYDALESLEKAFKKAKEAKDLEPEEQTASQGSRIELDKLLFEAKNLDLSDKPQDVKDKLNKTIGDLTLKRLDLSATLADINKAKDDIKNAIEEAKSSENLKNDLVAPYELKMKLSNLLAKARFTVGVGFSHEEVKAADKVFWNTKATVLEVNTHIEKLQELVK